MKKSLLLILPALVLATSCVDTLDDYNIDPKRPSSVPATSLVSNAELSLTRTLVSPSVNLNPFRLYVQHWAETTYYDESIYDIRTRNINGGFWTAIYRDVLRDLKEAKAIITADGTLDPAVKANQLASIEVLEVYAWTTLVDVFGNVPYSQALDFNNPQPKYDDAKTIYTDLFARLNAAIAKFDPTAEGLGSADLIYDGDVAEFAKFANSLKLRMALTISDDDAATAKTQAEATRGKTIASNSENADLAFQTSNPNTNPLFEQLVQSGRNDFVAANTFVTVLNNLSDPRATQFFKLKNGAIRGGVYGASNNYASFSAPGVNQEDPTHPGVLLSYAQVEFLLAEAVERGFNVGGTAKSHYDAGVTASIQQWGGSATDAAAYLLKPAVNYLTATGNYKQKIGTQAWIALYDQPVDGYREYRRLDYPALVKPAQALSNIPRRFFYPVVEQNLNTANNSAAATAIGGDNVDTRIFWDKF
ncbi:SusD/RagB family nutrient-binding outer membrane lipoprotein [Hymenobacter metallilatus]|uniref:SusD/RagB family nutrient-binding outer membrane lipoprotein n=1 Tax=Hymenobacter metallilatus TaxID=2493666 RepID=A0A3R9M7M9_9BACT|nr:SusD/RagB family nutrient-binding outer membrane lipoprotein [Hymenobacter metallilatus]RSK24280.1 SusD/RagB family nutrient-binding outer membrane lipoprotein [Hymenobacter metallilatus]